MSRREALYASLAALGLVVPWYFNVRYVATGGSFLDVRSLMEAAFANPLASSLTADVGIAFLGFVVWAPLESRRLGMRAGWSYPLLGLLLSFAFAFPLFLYRRERHLRGTAGAR